jgi:ABC-2 type transport system permease protein
MFRVQLIAQLQHRAAAWAGIATQFFFGFVFVMMFSAFYRDGTVVPPMPLDRLVAYQWLKQSCLMIVALWSQDGELSDQIVSGSVAYSLCRPMELYSLWAARLIANRIARWSLRCVPVLVFAALLPAPYGMIPPPGVGAALMFALSLALALLVVVGLSMYVYTLTFVMMSLTGPRLLVSTLSDFASGLLIPLPLMPDWLQRILNLLPFRYTADVPFRVYSGDLAGAAAAEAIGLQLAWVIFLGVTGWFAFRAVLRRAVIQGG